MVWPTITIDTTVVTQNIRPVDVTPRPRLKLLWISDPISGVREEIDMIAYGDEWRFIWSDRDTAFVNLPLALEASRIAEVVKIDVNAGSRPHTIYEMRLLVI